MKKLIVDKIEDIFLPLLMTYIRNHGLEVKYKKLYEKHIIAYLISKSKNGSNKCLYKYYLGIWYFQNHDFEKAQNIFNELLFNESYKKEMICFLTEIDLIKNEPQFTNSLINKKYTDKDIKIQSMLTYGNYYLTKKKYYQAQRIFTELLDFDNGNIEALVKIACIYERVDEIEKSLIYAKKVFEKEPSNNKIFLTLGRIEIKNNNLQKANKYLSRYYKYNKNDYECLYELALVNKNMKKLRKSKYYLENLINLNTNDWSSIYLLGEVLFEQKKYPKAFQYFSSLLEFNVNKNKVYNYLGLCKYFLGQYNDALLFYEESINSRVSRSSSSETYRLIGDVYEKLKKPKEKISYYKLAARNCDEIAQDWLNKFDIDY